MSPISGNAGQHVISSEPLVKRKQALDSYPNGSVIASGTALGFDMLLHENGFRLVDPNPPECPSVFRLYSRCSLRLTPNHFVRLDFCRREGEVVAVVALKELNEGTIWDV